MTDIHDHAPIKPDALAWLDAIIGRPPRNNLILFVPTAPITDAQTENGTGAGHETGPRDMDIESTPDVDENRHAAASRTPAPPAKKRHAGRPKGLSKTRREVWDWIHAHRGHKLTIDVVHAGTGRARGLCGEVLSLYREWNEVRR